MPLMVGAHGTLHHRRQSQVIQHARAQLKGQLVHAVQGVAHGGLELLQSGRTDNHLFGSIRFGLQGAQPQQDRSQRLAGLVVPLAGDVPPFVLPGGDRLLQQLAAQQIDA